MPTTIDVVLLSTGDDTRDCARFLAFLERNRSHVQRFLLVSVLGRAGSLLRNAVEQAGVPCEFLAAESSIAAVNGGILLRTGNVFVLADGLVDESGCLEELLEVFGAHDRVAAVVPVLDAGAATAGEAGAWLASSGIPKASEMPAPDLGAVLLGGDVLAMVGTLDLAFTTLEEALADWSMRAQRLGLVTLRANRALVYAAQGSSGPVILERMPQLDQRHPYFDGQREAYAQDLSSRITQNALHLHRGRISVCLDIRYLHVDAINGTGVHAMELSKALLEHTDARLSLCVEREDQQRAVQSLGAPVFLGAESLPSSVQVLHRPAQVFRPRDLPFLLQTPVPLVITFQDLIAYRAASTRASSAEHVEYQLLSYTALRSAQRILTFSEHTRQEIIREFSIPPDRVRAALLGVDARAFPGRDKALHASLLAPVEVPTSYFLFVGSDYAHKNLRLLLASYARVRAAWSGPGDPPGLLLVGHWSGTLDGAYPELARRPPPGVRYLGMVSDPVLRALYYEAIALVYLSTYEGFGLPLLEAMAAGTPVLCSRLSSIPEVVGEAAIFVDDYSDQAIGAQMLNLATSPALRERLVPLGLRRAAQFTWKRTAQVVMEVYREAIEWPSGDNLFDRRMMGQLARRAFVV
jgi:glycosyltransferase involved in cell wall biosynthesis